MYFQSVLRIMEFDPEHTIGIRQLLIDNFSAFYVIEGDKVIVTRVLYSASDISKRLSEK
jgi:plasmid stabilization system protein ParE